MVFDCVHVILFSDVSPYLKMYRPTFNYDKDATGKSHSQLSVEAGRRKTVLRLSAEVSCLSRAGETANINLLYPVLAVDRS